VGLSQLSIFFLVRVDVKVADYFLGSLLQNTGAG
jgi:hypothetical protein